MTQTSNSNQLKAGAILNYIIIVLNAFVGLLYTPYMLRMMGQSEYGLYSLVASIISYLTILDLGMGNAIIRYTAKFRAEGKQEEQYEMFGMFFLLYVVIGLISVVVGFGLYLNVDAMFGKTMTTIELDKARIMMLILIFNLAFTFPLSIFGSIMTAYERFVFPRIINIIRIILNTVVMIVLLQLGYKAITMVIVQTVFNLATLVINYLYCKYNLRIKLLFGKFNWLFLKEVAIYSFWILLNVIMDKVYWSTGQFVLGAVSGTIAVSVFAVAVHLQGMYMTFSAAISSVFLPKVTAMITNDSNDNEISNLFIRTGRIQFLVMFFVLCGFIVFGKPFVILWAGADYSEAYIMTLILFLATIVPLIQSLGFTILQAKNQMKFRSILYVIISVLALVLEIVLGKYFGGVGCSLAIAIAAILGQGILMNIYYHIRQNIDIILFWKEILKMSIAPLGLTLMSFLYYRNNSIASWKSLIIGMVFFCVIYIIITYFFSMNKSERGLFSEPFRFIIDKRKNLI